MRDLIALVTIGLGSLLVLVAARAITPHRPGRHSAEHFTDHQAKAAPVDPWAKPWPTPTPEHVRALFTPLRGEDVALTRPYCPMEDTMDLGVISERRSAIVHAELGMDYPYRYDGDDFEIFAARTAAGVTA